MNPLNFDNLAKTIIENIKAFEADSKADASSLTSKVDEFVKNNAQVIQEADRKNINDLLGRLKDANSKAAACKALANLIATVARAVQPSSEQLIKEALTNSATFAENFDKYNIQNEEDRFHLAEHVASENLIVLVKNLDKFKLNESHRIYFAICLSKQSAANFPDISEHIQKFGITNEKALVKIAGNRIGSFKQRFELCKHIKNYDLSEAARSGLALRIAAEDDAVHLGTISTYIQNFDLPPETRLTVAKKGDVLAVVKNIKNYQLDHQARLEIAKTIPPKVLVMNIMDFDLSPSERLALAKTAATLDSNSLSTFIKNYNIQNESDRFDVAQIAVQSGDISIENFELTKEHQIALAYQCANAGKTLKNFRNLAIADEKIRYEIASILIGKNPSKLCHDIEKYQLSEDKCYDFAITILNTSIKADFQDRYFNVLASDFHKFGIKKTVYLDKIINIFIEYGAEALCISIRNFGLSEEKRFEIASKLIEKGHEREVASNIRNFQLNYAKKLVIAEEIVRRSPQTAAGYFCYFDLKPEDNLRLAWMIARRHPGISPDITNFDLTLPDRLAIARFVVSKQPMFTLAYLVQYGLKEIENGEILFRALTSSPDHAPLLLDSFGDIPIQIPKEFEDLNKQVEESQKEGIKPWWTAFQFIINACPPERLQECAALAQLIFDFANPAARYMLSTALLQYDIPQALPDMVEHKKLLNIIVAPLLKEAKLTDAERKEVWAVLASKDYREASKKEKTVKGLYSLLDCPELTSEDKRALLKHIFENNKKNPAHNALQMLEAIICSENTAMLKEPATKEADEKDTKAAAGNAPQKLTPIDLEKTLEQIFKTSIGMEALPKFREKYEATMGKSRNPLALLIYAANLGSLPDGERQETLEALKTFTESVLNETYSTMRYQAPPKSHLATVFEKRPQLQKDWQQGASMSIGELYKKSAEEGLKMAAAKVEMDDKENTETMTMTLRQKVLHDKHLDPEVYKHFAACLKNGKNCKEALTKCKADLKVAAEELRKKDLTLNSLNPDLKNAQTLPYFQRKLEEALITLLNAPVNQRSSLIDKLIPNVRKLYGAKAQFASDLELLKLQLEDEAKKAKDSKAGFQKPEANYDHYIISDTDVWDDMALSGTEVAGSCQRIGGDVGFNKCLLAYMLDGKNRAIVVKDPKTGTIDPKTGKIDPKTCKIVARSLMRLLWDAENKTPVLFQERLYFNLGVPDRAKAAIDLMFSRRAKQLQVPLVKSLPDLNDNAALATIPRYPKDLSSLNSPAPFEYVDAARQGVTNGKYTIPASAIQFIQPA